MADQQNPGAENMMPGVNPWFIALAVILPAFMEVIDTSIASVCIPYIAGSLASSSDEASYVLTFYLLSNAIILPASGWLSLRFGRKRFLMSSIVIFTVASFFCGAANSLILILIARLVQGAGGGALQPLSQAILIESFPAEKRGLAQGLFGLGVVVAPILGPTVGGWLTDQYSWRWAFYINIPIGILALFLIHQFIKDPPYIKNADPGRLDGIGLGFLALWLGGQQLILDRGQVDDWFGATWIRWTFGITVISFVGFVVTQLKRAKPLVDLKIFRNRNFAIGTGLIFMFGAAIYGIVSILPLFLQDLLQYSSTASGFVVAPRGVGAILAMPLVGFLVGKLDTRFMVSLGFFVFGLCSLAYGHITMDISPWSLTVPIIISGFSLGLVFVPLSATTLGGLRREEIGNGSGLFNLMRNVGGSVGISIVNTIILRHEQLHRNELGANLYGSNPVVQNSLQSFTRLFSSAGASAPDAQHQAYGQLQQVLGQQAQLWSYVDDFRYLALACILCVPVVWLLKSVKGGAPAGAH
jgi:DHA2 family multidrug resistance protein